MASRQSPLLIHRLFFVNSLLAPAIHLVLILSLFARHSTANHIQGQATGLRHNRALLGFKETPSGGNTTFECSPSGPCIACQYSEKNEEKYRCSETGYRIPLKCVKIVNVANEENDEKEETRSTLEVLNSESHTDSGLRGSENVKHRTLAESKTNKAGESEVYVTYRSCIPAVNEEKISVVGFEVFTLALLLASGSFVFLRRRRTSVASPAAGGIRMQTNPRF